MDDAAAIDLYHDTDENVIYLSIISDRDSTQLFNSVLSAPTDALSSPEVGRPVIDYFQIFLVICV